MVAVVDAPCLADEVVGVVAGDVLGGIGALLDRCDARGAGELFSVLEHLRRRVEAAQAAVIATVDRHGWFDADGHRTVEAWIRAQARTSTHESRVRAQTARVVAEEPQVASELAAGRLGVEQARRLGKARAHPRCGDQLTEFIPQLVTHAETLPCDDFDLVVRRWTTLADTDGSADSHERAHRERGLSISRVGNRVRLDGSFAATAGATLMGIVARFEQAEFDTDWAATVAAHGEHAIAALMPRTARQRRADALLAAVEQAVLAPADGKRPEPVVNIVVDADTLTETIDHSLGDQPTGHGLDPSVDLRSRRCETVDGVPLSARDVLVAAIVGQIRVVVMRGGVVVDAGRTRRLFTGAQRDLVLLAATHCIWPGCTIPATACQADHLTPWHTGGGTDTANGAPDCGHHNRWRQRHRYHLTRQPDGTWHTTRPDGTRITDHPPPDAS